MSDKVTHQIITVLKTGDCECIAEPMGANGLEGYQIGKNYNYEFVKMMPRGMHYYRVFPTVGLEYYETVGPFIFARYFKVASGKRGV